MAYLNDRLTEKGVNIREFVMGTKEKYVCSLLILLCTVGLACRASASLIDLDPFTLWENDSVNLASSINAAGYIGPSEKTQTKTNITDVFGEGLWIGSNSIIGGKVVIYKAARAGRDAQLFSYWTGSRRNLRINNINVKLTPDKHNTKALKLTSGNKFNFHNTTEDLMLNVIAPEILAHTFMLFESGTLTLATDNLRPT